MKGKAVESQTPSLGTLLVRAGLLTPDQLTEALTEQSRTRERLGEILCRRGHITPADLADALARQLGYRRFDPARDAILTPALELVPLDFARRHNLLPVRLDDSTLTVALADPLDVEALDHLRRIAGVSQRMIEILIAPSDVLEKAREANYTRIEGNRSVSVLIDKVVGEVAVTMGADEDLDESEAQRRAQDAGIINLVDQIITQALQERATDIHIEPQQSDLVIRFRVDGLLYDALAPPRAVYTGAISRVKILANMDIAERRAPQDGRFTHRKNGWEVDVRVSSIPTIHGEKLVLRLLDKTNFNFSLRDLGFSEAHYGAFLHAIRQPYGMVLLSGPTGSGKSTTLYSALLEIRNEALNITTVEDPVEYQISRINQVQVNERKRVTFANALRSFLRQDPDVIMVGEIRDQETAEIAVRAALTGHLVFSTIHANDAPTTAVRLVSMGVEPFMAASSLALVAAQRLVRRCCKNCLVEYQPAEEVLLAMQSGDGSTPSISKARWVKGAGCALCKGRGYQGRIAILELMPLSPKLREMMAGSRPAGEIRREAIHEGMLTLRRNGLQKALEGTTTVEEILRVCLSDE